MLTFQDSDLNTGLHFAAKIGNAQICEKIISEAVRLDIIDLIINCRNADEFTPLILVSWRGYHTISEKDKAIHSRHLIIDKLIRAGAWINYCNSVTLMTAMHWLAFNNDHLAIEVLLKNKAEHSLLTHDGLLPIDIAGTKPSLQSLDILLRHYSSLNQLPAPREFHNDFSKVDMYLDE